LNACLSLLRRQLDGVDEIVDLSGTLEEYISFAKRIKVDHPKTEGGDEADEIDESDDIEGVLFETK
jgi:hypothetical protein